jgi:hypothetical protein
MTIRRLALPIALGVAACGPAPAQQRDPTLKQYALARAEIPASQGRYYEADHIIPLCLGGPDTLANIQLQPWAEARRKDEVEIAACARVRRGEITRAAGRAIFIGHVGRW